VFAALLSQRLAARDKKSSTFYLWRAPTSAYFTLYLLAYVAARKKLFRIKVDDKKLKRKAPSLLCFFQVCSCMFSHLLFFCRMIVQQLLLEGQIICFSIITLSQTPAVGLAVSEDAR
jgi:hypothetical protein